MPRPADTKSLTQPLGNDRHAGLPRLSLDGRADADVAAIVDGGPEVALALTPHHGSGAIIQGDSTYRPIVGRAPGGNPARIQRALDLENDLPHGRSPSG